MTARRGRLRAVPDPPQRTYAEAVQALPPKYVRCRASSHPWDAYTAGPIVQRRRVVGYDMDEVCERCGMHRVSVLDRAGFIVSRRYRGPKDYPIRGYSDTPKSERNAVVRLQMVADVINPPVGGKRKGQTS